MRELYLKPSILILLCALFSSPLLAQNDNLKVAFKDAASAPRNLNVCGDEATVTLTVATDGSLSATRRKSCGGVSTGLPSVFLSRYRRRRTVSAFGERRSVREGVRAMETPDFLPASYYRVNSRPHQMGVRSPQP